MGDSGLTELNSDIVEALEVAVRKIGITLADIVDRLVHPYTLVIFSRREDSAAINVTEQLVTCAIKKLFF
jgi:hypothetical protein